MFESFSIDLALRFKHSIPSSRKEKEGKKKHKKEKRKRMCEVFNLFTQKLALLRYQIAAWLFPAIFLEPPGLRGLN